MAEIQTQPVGRPTVMTDATVQKLREAFLMGCTDIEACLYADISRATLGNYQRENPEFLVKKEEWKQAPILKARNNIMIKLNEEEIEVIDKVDPITGEKKKVLKSTPSIGAVETAKWYLERKAKNEFSTRTENVNYDVNEIEKSLDKLETDYDTVAGEAQKQMVALDPPVQDQGQTGSDQDVQPEHNATPPSGGEGQPPV